MARDSIRLNTDRAEWHTPSGARPLRAILVGGVPSYKNVQRLPEKLWETYGIAVTRHVHDFPPPAFSEEFDVAIILVDQASTALQAWGKTQSDLHVFGGTSWAKTQLAIANAGITPIATKFEQPKPEPEQEPQVKDMSQKVEPSGIPKPIKDLIHKLKAEMIKNDFAFINLEIHEAEPGNPGLSVDYKRIVVQSGLEIL